VVVPEQVAQLVSHCWQVPSTLVVPVGQLATQTPLTKAPVEQVQTPLTEVDPLGHLVRHLPLVSTKPVKHPVHTSSDEQVEHG
jgi:hypothetical protein